MLSASRYLLGVLEIALLLGFAWLGAAAARRRLVPELIGAPSHLATAVLALAVLIWVAELLGSFSAFEAVPYLLLVAAIGVSTWTLLYGWRGGREAENGRQFAPARGPSSPHARTRGRGVRVVTVIAFAIAAIAVLHFADGVHQRLGTGMTGFD